VHKAFNYDFTVSLLRIKSKDNHIDTNKNTALTLLNWLSFLRYFEVFYRNSGKLDS